MPEEAKRIRPRNQVVLIGGTSALVAIVMLALIRTDRKKEQITRQDGGRIKAEAFGGTPAPTPPPAPEWVRATTAYKNARGVHLAITYPQGDGNWQVWRDGDLWRDETPQRVYGFDGTREWVWVPKERRVVAWKPGRNYMGTLKYPGKDYYLPYLLRLFYGAESGSLSRVGDSHWELYDNAIGRSRIRTNAENDLPDSEEGQTRTPLLLSARPELFKPGLTQENKEVTDWAQPLQIPMFYLHFRLNGATPGGRISRVSSADIFNTILPTPPPPLPAEAPVTYTVKASYGALPQAGFAPPKDIPVTDLDALTKHWRDHLKQSQLTTLTGPRFEAIIRHAGQDSLGNINLLYTGDTLTPEVFRPQRVLTLEIPGYSAARTPDNLYSTLPEYVGNSKLHLLRLVPLRCSTTLPRTVTLRWADTPKGGTAQTVVRTLSLTPEPDGPDYWNAIYGPPTVEQRQRNIAQIIRLATVRAGDRTIDPPVADEFEAVTKETWESEPPWQVLFWMAQLERAALQNKKAYEYAQRAYTLAKKDLASDTSARAQDQLTNIQALLSALAM